MYILSDNVIDIKSRKDAHIVITGYLKQNLIKRLTYSQLYRAMFVCNNGICIIYRWCILICIILF